jgi:hypothetical protein
MTCTPCCSAFFSMRPRSRVELVEQEHARAFGDVGFGLGLLGGRAALALSIL